MQLILLWGYTGWPSCVCSSSLVQEDLCRWLVLAEFKRATLLTPVSQWMVLDLSMYFLEGFTLFRDCCSFFAKRALQFQWSERINLLAYSQVWLRPCLKQMLYFELQCWFLLIYLPYMRGECELKLHWAPSFHKMALAYLPTFPLPWVMHFHDCNGKNPKLIIFSNYFSAYYWWLKWILALRYTVRDCLIFL